jgi:hypothetical protein
LREAIEHVDAEGVDSFLIDAYIAEISEIRDH